MTVHETGASPPPSDGGIHLSDLSEFPGPPQTEELEEATRCYIDTVNANPRPFRWTKSADDILANIKRFCLRTIDTAERQKKIIKTSE